MTIGLQRSEVCLALKTAIKSAGIPISGFLDNRRRKIRAKSLVLEYFTCKSFKLKDLAENFA
jgi:hypothetical protein